MPAIFRSPDYSKKASSVSTPRAGTIPRRERAVSMPDQSVLPPTLTAYTSRLPRPRTNVYTSSSAPNCARPSHSTPSIPKVTQRSLPSSCGSPIVPVRPLSIGSKKGSPPRMPSPPLDNDSMLQVVKLNPQTIFLHIKRVTKGDPASKENRDEFLAAHERQMGEQREREEVRRMYLNKQLQPAADYPDIFKSNFRAVSKFASIYTIGITADRTKDVPVIVWKCVEHLAQSDLRGAATRLPQAIGRQESSRVAVLRKIFNTAPNFGMDFDLHEESLGDVYVLLRTFMDHLTGVDRVNFKSQSELLSQKPKTRFLRKKKAVVEPTPANPLPDEDYIFTPSRLVDMIDDSCVPSRVDFARKTDPSVIEAAQSYLRLLPPAQLALFCYLAKFGTEIYNAVDEARSNNAEHLDAITHTFAVWFFASPSRPVERTDNLMRFFFRNWSRIERNLYMMPFDNAPVSTQTNMTTPKKEQTTVKSKGIPRQAFHLDSDSSDVDASEKSDVDSMDAHSVQGKACDMPGGAFDPGPKVLAAPDNDPLHFGSQISPSESRGHKLSNRSAKASSMQLERQKPVTDSPKRFSLDDARLSKPKPKLDGMPMIRDESLDIEAMSPGLAYDGLAYDMATPRPNIGENGFPTDELDPLEVAGAELCRNISEGSACTSEYSCESADSEFLPTIKPGSGFNMIEKLAAIDVSRSPIPPPAPEPSGASASSESESEPDTSAPPTPVESLFLQPLPSSESQLNCPEETHSKFCSNPRCPSIAYVRELEAQVAYLSGERQRLSDTVEDINLLLGPILR